MLTCNFSTESSFTSKWHDYFISKHCKSIINCEDLHWRGEVIPSHYLSDNSNTDANNTTTSNKLYNSVKWFYNDYSGCNCSDKLTSIKCWNIQFSVNCLIGELCFNCLITSICIQLDCKMLSYPNKLSFIADWRLILFFGPSSIRLKYLFTYILGYTLP